MALSYSVVSKNVVGAKRVNLVRVTIGVAGDYSTGLTLSAASCGLGSIDYVHAVGSSGGTTRAMWEWDHTTSKLRGYKSNTAALMTEVAGSDVAAMVIQVEVNGDQANDG